VRKGLGRKPENSQCQDGFADEAELVRFAYALRELGVECGDW